MSTGLYVALGAVLAVVALTALLYLAQTPRATVRGAARWREVSSPPGMRRWSVTMPDRGRATVILGEDDKGPVVVIHAIWGNEVQQVTLPPALGLAEKWIDDQIAGRAAAGAS